MNRLLSSLSSRPVSRGIVRIFERFLAVEAASGVVLLLATASAFVWANSQWSATYEAFWATPVTLRVGSLAATQSLRLCINEGLMTIFFLVVGLEIRRELHNGALANRRVAALPMTAAMGGVLVPALIYLAVNNSAPLSRGWAVPTATDIAFSVGVLTLLGRRVPSSLRALLLTLAIVDDIIAMVIIAGVYSNGVALMGAVIAMCGILAALAFQRIGIPQAFVYVLPGALIWIGLLNAGLHPALAGVVLGLVTPAARPPDVRKLRHAPRRVLSAVERMEATLHPWVAYGIMPLFALANAGVPLHSFSGVGRDGLQITAGVLLGLVLGKPIGIAAASWVAIRLRLGSLPRDLAWRHVLLLGCLGGIGFTMSIFIANLTFSNADQLASSKLAVLLASMIAATGGLLLGRQMLPLGTVGPRCTPAEPA